MTSGHLNELWAFVWSFIFLAPNKLMENTKTGRAGREIDGRSHCAMKGGWCGKKTVRKQVWMMCLGVSLQQVTEPGSKCDSFHFWQFGENKGQKSPAVLDTRIAASGTSDINDIGVFTWFKSSTSAKEASACVTKCNWGYWSTTQLWTAGASLRLLRLRGCWELMAPAPHFSPKGSARADTSREPPNCTELTSQYGHISISDLNPLGTIMSPHQHISLTPSTCSSFPSDYFQVLWDCFQWR